MSALKQIGGASEPRVHLSGATPRRGAHAQNVFPRTQDRPAPRPATPRIPCSKSIKASATASVLHQQPKRQRSQAARAKGVTSESDSSDPFQPGKEERVREVINGVLPRLRHGRAVVVVFVGGSGAGRRDDGCAAAAAAGAADDDEQPAVEQGGGQGVRERAGGFPGACAEPVGAGGVAAAGALAAGGLGPLPGAGGRRRPHRARRGGGPRRLGRRGPRGTRTRRRRRRGAPPRRAVDGGGAQAVSGRAVEVREGRLAEHLAVVGEDADADAGGQPRAEVLHPPGKRRQPRGQQAQEHP